MDTGLMARVYVLMLVLLVTAVAGGCTTAFPRDDASFIPAPSMPGIATAGGPFPTTYMPILMQRVTWDTSDGDTPQRAFPQNTSEAVPDFARRYSAKETLDGMGAGLLKGASFGSGLASLFSAPVLPIFVLGGALIGAINPAQMLPLRPPPHETRSAEF